jgi:hypothetical protein
MANQNQPVSLSETESSHNVFSLTKAPHEAGKSSAPCKSLALHAASLTEI